MRNFFLGAVSAIALTGVAAVLLVPGSGPEAASSETYRSLNLFGDVFEKVRSDYVDQTNDSELVEAAINGMLASLDPHSQFLNAKSFREMQVQTRGEFGGLGIEVTQDGGYIKVISPIDETPAARAGVRPGDFITHLNGTTTQGMTLQEAVEQMRGERGSAIRLTIRREGAERPLEISITRDVIRPQVVRFRMEGNDVGYIRMSSFNEQTETALRRAVQTLRSQGGTNLRGLILDMRNNPGGLLDQSVQVTDAFLNQGEIVSTRGRKQEEGTRYNAKRGDLTDGKPMVVLVNGGSASASEIVAGALQDHKRAIILGTKSFGKGSVQTIIPLQGQGALKLTTQRYYTPSGRSIQAKGIEPDVEVQQAKIEVAETPKGRSEADLKNHLQSGSDPKPAEPQAVVPGQNAPAEATDYQLLRALDLLRGVSLFGARNGTPTPSPN